MTAVLGVTYPNGVILASDGFRTDGQTKIYNAQKVFKGPNLVLGASGSTGYSSPAFGEILHLHKVMISAIFTNNSRKSSIEEADLVSYYRDYVRLLLHLSPNAMVPEVLIGFPSATPTLITISGGASAPGWSASTTCAAIGNAHAYIDFVTAPQAIPAPLMQALSSLPAPPPLLEHCGSMGEAKDWLGKVIEWVCRGFPDSCGGNVQFENLETP